MEARNFTCQICNRADPDWYCKCQNSVTRLCHSCLSSHHDKNREGQHHNGPISSLQDSGEEERRRETFKHRVLEARQSVQAMHICRVDVSNRIEVIIGALRQFKEDFCNTMEANGQQLEADIAAAEQEVRLSLKSADPQLSCDLARAMRSYSPGSLPVFTYSIEIEDVVSKVRAGVKTRIQPYTVVETPAAVLPGKSAEFDIDWDRWKPATPLQRPVTVDCDSSVVTLDKGQLFICGGRHKAPFSTAFLLDVDKVTDLPYLPQGRALAGALYSPKRNHVYLFGGYDGGNAHSDSDLHTCLSFDLEQRTWPALPNMHSARVGFNPCWSGEIVYLPGGCISIETFTPTDGVMRVLDLQLPDCFAEFQCVSVFDGNDLILVSNQTVVRVDVRVERLAVAALPKAKVREWSQSRPIYRGGKIYFIDLHFRQCVCIQPSAPVSISTFPFP